MHGPARGSKLHTSFSNEALLHALGIRLREFGVDLSSQQQEADMSDASSVNFDSRDSKRPCLHKRRSFRCIKAGLLQIVVAPALSALGPAAGQAQQAAPG